MTLVIRRVNFIFFKYKVLFTVAILLKAGPFQLYFISLFFFPALFLRHYQVKLKKTSFLLSYFAVLLLFTAKLLKICLQQRSEEFLMHWGRKLLFVYLNKIYESKEIWVLFPSHSTCMFRNTLCSAVREHKHKKEICGDLHNAFIQKFP